MISDLLSVSRLAVVAALSLVLAACSLPRVIEAARVLGDIVAGEEPSSLKDRTPTPERVPVAYRVDGRAYDGDLYLPGDRTEGAIVLVPGVSRAGKNDRRLVAFANTLARARFAVLVPDMQGLKALKVRATDVREIAHAIAYFADSSAAAGHDRIGLVAVSYAVGPAILAALEPDVRDRMGFVVGIGGYWDLEAVVTYFTTGHYRERPDEPWRRAQPNAYGKWVFVLSNVEQLESAADRAILDRMARLKFDDPDAGIAKLAARLGPEGRSVYALLDNADPERVPALLAALPAGVKAELAALNLKGRDVSRLSARLILIHGRDDTIIPYTESVALAAALPKEQAELYLVDSLAHVDLGPTGLIDTFTLWRAVYRLLEQRSPARPAG